jgi:tRNA nucleotidyltransferase (CCA-adding enzyme)
MGIHDMTNKLPSSLRALITTCAGIGRKQGYSVYLVGGFVRDMLMGADNFDIDLVVEKDGIGYARALASSINAHCLVHPRFGTAVLTIAGSGVKIDISTARSETYPAPGALPVVSFGSLREDLSRRDFSINAMALGVSGPDSGELVDLHGGRQDLKNGIIRVMHEGSFRDDPTRILRAVRFKERFGFRFDPLTRSLLRESVKGRMIHTVQQHRVRDELVLILKEKDPVKPLAALEALMGFSFLAPRIAFGREKRALVRRMRKEYEWFAWHFTRRRKVEEWVLYLLALFDGVPLAQVKKACRSFAFAKADQARVLSYAQDGAAAARRLAKPGIRKSAVYALLEPLSFEVQLALKASYCSGAAAAHIDEFLRFSYGTRLQLTGHDLAAIGIAPGPAYKKILDAMLAAKIDGSVKTRADEITLARSFSSQRAAHTIQHGDDSHDAT